MKLPKIKAIRSWVRLIESWRPFAAAVTDRQLMTLARRSLSVRRPCGRRVMEDSTCLSAGWTGSERVHHHHRLRLLIQTQKLWWQGPLFRVT